MPVTFIYCTQQLGRKQKPFCWEVWCFAVFVCLALRRQSGERGWWKAEEVSGDLKQSSFTLGHWTSEVRVKFWFGGFYLPQVAISAVHHRLDRNMNALLSFRWCWLSGLHETSSTGKPNIWTFHSGFILLDRSESYHCTKCWKHKTP